MKHEAALKSAFGALLSQQPSFYMLQLATRAAPDRLIVGNGHATFWEMKHGTPGFVSPGDQELMCNRLATAGYCRYVIWQESSRGEDQRTLVVHPRAVLDKSMVPEAWCNGFDHQWLVRFVLRRHGV